MHDIIMILITISKTNITTSSLLYTLSAVRETDVYLLHFTCYTILYVQYNILGKSRVFNIRFISEYCKCVCVCVCVVYGEQDTNRFQGIVFHNRFYYHLDIIQSDHFAETIP